MKKLKAFTLIELIVVIAIFGIIMTGVVQMISPISSAATNSKVLNNQQTVENAMATYLGENLRYASNLLIIEEGSEVKGTKVTNAETAIDAFFVFKPVNSAGQVYPDDTSGVNRSKVNVICFDGKTDFVNASDPDGTGNASKGTAPRVGRFMTSMPDRAVGSTVDFSKLAPDGSKNQYMVFGNEFYGPAKYYMTVCMDQTSHVLDLRITSDYYYSISKDSAQSKTGNHAGNGKSTYELRNYAINGGYVFRLVRTSSTGDGIAISPTNANKVYFVYTDERCIDGMVVDSSISPGVTASDLNLNGCEESYGSNPGNTGGNTGNTSGNTGNTSGNTGNTSGNTGNTGGNTGNTSGNTGNTGGNTGNTSGNTGNTSGNTGNTGGNTGNTGGNTGNTGGTPAPLPGASVTVGHVTANVVTSGKGCYGVTESGGSVTVKVGNDENNTVDITITKNEDGQYEYTATFTGGNKWNLDQSVFPEMWNNDSYNLTDAQIKYLRDSFGVELN